MFYRHTLLVGIGSPHGDDQLGWLVADGVPPALKSGCTVRRAANPVDLLDWLDGVRRLILCDACDVNAPPGTSFRWVWPDPSMLRLQSGDTHQLQLAEVLELAGELGVLPAEVIVWGMQIESARPLTTAVSPAVAAALPAVIAGITAEIQSLAHQ